jgi:hypothetical protein
MQTVKDYLGCRRTFSHVRRSERRQSNDDV